MVFADKGRMRNVEIRIERDNGTKGLKDLCGWGYVMRDWGFVCVRERREKKTRTWGGGMCLSGSEGNLAVGGASYLSTLVAELF